MQNMSVEEKIEGQGGSSFSKICVGGGGCGRAEPPTLMATLLVYYIITLLPLATLMMTNHLNAHVYNNNYYWHAWIAKLTWWKWWLVFQKH